MPSHDQKLSQPATKLATHPEKIASASCHLWVVSFSPTTTHHEDGYQSGCLQESQIAKDMGRVDDDEKSQTCCTWIKIASVFAVLIVIGILIWQFAPIDNAIDSVLPTFNNTGTGNSSTIGGGSTSPPAPQIEYEFMQCADPTSPDCCNGLDNGLCDLRVDEVMFAASHNANADFESGFLFSPNHQYKLEDSLPAGYRLINVDVCNCGGELVLCHGVCNFGTRDVVEVLSGINDFLDENPSEIIIVPLELNGEVDQAIDINDLYTLILQVPGFVDKFYDHSNATAEWPTLGELKETGKRVLLFHYRGPTCDEEGSCPAGMMPYYRYSINTRFDLDSLDQVANSTFSCSFDQAPQTLGTTFFGINNFVTMPTQSVAQTMNAYDFLSNRVDTCSSIHNGLDVNFVYVDFWDEGDLPRLVQERNSALAMQRKLAKSHSEI